MILLIDVITFNCKQSVYFSDKSIRIAVLVLIEILQMREQIRELCGGYCFENIFIVGGEEKELAAPSAIALENSIDLIAILQNLKAFLYVFETILIEKCMKDTWSVHC